MNHRFSTHHFRGQRADALLSDFKARLAVPAMQANMALVMADEACGQTLITQVHEWLRQEISGGAVWTFTTAPTKGGAAGDAQVQVMLGHIEGAGALQANGPIDTWSFAALNAQFAGTQGGTTLIALDPRTPFIPQRLQMIEEASETFLVGAIGAPLGAYTGPRALSCGPAVPVISRTFPGLERLVGDYQITAAQGQIIQEIDGKPALDVLKSIAGDILARKPMQIPHTLFAAFPVSEGDPSDFLTRRISGLGSRDGVFSVEDEVMAGMPLAFARRSGPHAAKTLGAGLADTLTHLGAQPRGAIYLQDTRRDQDFERPDAEFRQVSAALADVPLIYGRVEGLISHNRLYTHASQLLLIV